MLNVLEKDASTNLKQVEEQKNELFEDEALSDDLNAIFKNDLIKNEESFSQKKIQMKLLPQKVIT